MENQESNIKRELELDPKFGKEVPMDEASNTFVEAYTRAINRLANYHCTIGSFERCGEANLGISCYLVNSDNRSSYIATVRVHWQRGTQTGYQDIAVHIAAGARSYLGCSLPSIGLSYYYQVIGETSAAITPGRFEIISGAVESDKTLGGGSCSLCDCREFKPSGGGNTCINTNSSGGTCNHTRAEHN